MVLYGVVRYRGVSAREHFCCYIHTCEFIRARPKPRYVSMGTHYSLGANWREPRREKKTQSISQRYRAAASVHEAGCTPGAWSFARCWQLSRRCRLPGGVGLREGGMLLLQKQQPPKPIGVCWCAISVKTGRANKIEGIRFCKERMAYDVPVFVCRTVLYGVVRCRTVFYGAVRCRTVLYGVVRYCTVSYGVVRSRIRLSFRVSYDAGTNRVSYPTYGAPPSAFGSSQGRSIELWGLI